MMKKQQDWRTLESQQAQPCQNLSCKQQDPYPPVPSLDLMRVGIMMFFVLLIGAGMVALMIFTLLSLSSCNAEPEVRITLTETEVSQEEQVRMFSELYYKSHAMPEVLATTMSAFPTLAKAAGMRDVDAQSIDWTLSFEPNGGEVQEALLRSLIEQVLLDESTEVKFYSCTGTATQLVLIIPDDADPTPETVEIGEEEVELGGVTLMAVTVHYADGASETGYFDVASDYRRTIFDLADARIEASSQRESATDQDALGVITQNMMANLFT